MPAGPVTAVAAVVLAGLSCIGLFTIPDEGEPLPVLRECPESAHPPSLECPEALPCPVCASSADVAAAAEAAVAPVRAELEAARSDGVWLRFGAFLTSVVFSFLGGVCALAWRPAPAPAARLFEAVPVRLGAALPSFLRPEASPSPTLSTRSSPSPTASSASSRRAPSAKVRARAVDPLSLAPPPVYEPRR
jgi:hypothetical protein